MRLNANSCRHVLFLTRSRSVKEEIIAILILNLNT